MSKFGGMKKQRLETAQVGEAEPDAAQLKPAVHSPQRQGKKAVSAYYSPEVSRGLHVLAVENDTSLQALLGEAIDDLMRKYGKHPFGER